MVEFRWAQLYLSIWVLVSSEYLIDIRLALSQSAFAAWRRQSSPLWTPLCLPWLRLLLPLLLLLLNNPHTAPPSPCWAHCLPMPSAVLLLQILENAHMCVLWHCLLNLLHEFLNWLLATVCSFILLVFSFFYIHIKACVDGRARVLEAYAKTMAIPGPSKYLLRRATKHHTSSVSGILTSC